MRASSTAQTGALGVTEVTASLERLGWGVTEIARHDNGTDLFIAVRDRGFDLGKVLGAQVKSGPSQFAEPVLDSESGLHIGWWWRDADSEHTDYWLSHAIPHILILHNLDAQVSYWAHVKSDAVRSTGKGVKVLVRKENTISADCRDALTDVAVTPTPRMEWEGSAWTGSDKLLERDRLRHALLTPRLIAPHPNAGHGAVLSPIGAIAMIVQARLSELRQFAEAHDEVPHIAAASESDDWYWRFAAAMWRSVSEDGSEEELHASFAEAADPQARAAAAVAIATRLVETGHPEEADELLQREMTCDHAYPVDQAWLAMQRARACSEFGKHQEAKDLALLVRSIGAAHPDDATARALAGAAGALLFNLSFLRDDHFDLAALITGGDTVAAWWRNQTISRGLREAAKHSFAQWSSRSDAPVSRSAANDQLYSAALQTSYVGDQVGWANLSSLVSQNALMSLDPDEQAHRIADVLTDLRWAGDEAAMKAACLRICREGPTSAIVLAARSIDLSKATRTSCDADLALLQYGADFLPTDVADTAIDWIVATLRDHAVFSTRASPTFMIDYRFAETLNEILPAASIRARQVVAEYVATVDTGDNVLANRSWADVVRSLPRDSWTAPLLSAISARDLASDSDLSTALLGVISTGENKARTVLVQEAREGSLNALSALGDVRKLEPEVVQQVVRSLATRTRELIEKATNQEHALGGHDVGRALALVNGWHPDLAEWAPVVELVASPHVAGRNKIGALATLTAAADRLPAEVATELAEAAIVAASIEPAKHGGVFSLGDARSAAWELSFALNAVMPEQAAVELASLIAGPAAARASACRIARRLADTPSLGILLALVRDRDDEVRAEAAAGLAAISVGDQPSPLAVAGLRLALRDGGNRVPAAIAIAISETKSTSPIAMDVSEQLRSHSSAWVRGLVATP